MINLTLLNQYPETQVTINTVLSLVTVLYIAFYKPYNDLINQVSNLLTEIGVLFFMGFMSVNLTSVSDYTLHTFETIMILIVLGVMAIQIVASILIFVKTCLEIIKEGLNKGGKYELKNNAIDSTKGDRKVMVFNDKPTMISYNMDYLENRDLEMDIIID